MQNRHPIITHAYHFLSEAFILFLLILPFMHYYYNWVPYWTYVLTSLGICLLFSIFSKWFISFGPYITSVPFMIVAFYMLKFPIVISVILGVTLTWRYINIRIETMISRENSYIRWTLVLATLNVLFINDRELIIYVFLLFMILIIGYISGHLAVIHRDDRKRFDQKFWLYIMGGLAIGTVIVYFSFNTIRFIVAKIWAGFSYVLTLVGGLLVSLLQNIELDFRPDYEDPEQLGEQESPIPEEFQHSDTYLLENITPIIIWIMIALIIGALVWMAIRLYRGRFEAHRQVDESDVVSYGNLDESNERGENLFQRMIKNYFKTPQHPIRKMVYQFERKAAKANYGRHRYETIENWMERIGLDMDLDTYQKVRYGHMEVSDDDIKDLKKQLENMEAFIETSHKQDS